MYCSKCGAQIHDEAEICIHCGCRVKPAPTMTMPFGAEINLVRFLLTFFLGWIGSLIINYTNLKPKGWKCRTLAYLFLGIVTFGIYPLVASICNFSFDEKNASNVGYYKE